jgi:CRP-like cAMP-binding protein
VNEESFTLLGDGRVYAEEVSNALERWGCHFTTQELETVLGCAKVCAVSAGQTLFKEGSRATFMGILISGELQVFKHGGGSEARCIYVVGPGKAFGEMALVDGEPRSAELRAAKDSEFMLLSQDNFRSLCCSQPTIGLKMLMQISRSLSQRLRRVSGQLVDYLGN